MKNKREVSLEKHKEEFDHLEPHEIEMIDIDRYKNRLLKKLKPATVWGILEILRRTMNYGAKRKLIPAIQFQMEMPKVNNEKTEDLTPEELQRLLEAMEADPNTMAASMLNFVLFTGLRRSEVFRLKWTDINFDRGFLLIRRDPKGKKAFLSSPP